MRRDATGFRALLATLAVALVVAGCTSGPGPGEAIAERIRAANSPIVREVEVSPANPWQGEGDDSIYVYLVEPATEAQALEFWCEVMIPAGVDQLPREQVWLLKGGEPQPGGGRQGAYRAVRDPVCPTEQGESMPQ